MKKILDIKKIVTDNNSGKDWFLEDYPAYSDKGSGEELLEGKSISLERAKQLAFEITENAYDYADEIEDADNLQDLEYALSDLKEYQRDNTYNVSWWGGVIDFGVLTDDSSYGKALVILRMHRGGDPRGNYSDYEAFELDSYAEEFPTYAHNLTYEIETEDGTITLDADDFEGYSLRVVSDETETYEEDDYVSLDDIENDFDLDGNSMYSWGGGIAIGGILGGYLGYKIGRARPQKYGFDTERKIGQGIKKTFSKKKKMAKGGGVDKLQDRIKYQTKWHEQELADLKRGKRKTINQYYVQGNYGYGWEDLTSHNTRAEAIMEKRTYDENESYPHRVVTKRIKKADFESGNYANGGGVREEYGKLNSIQAKDLKDYGYVTIGGTTYYDWGVATNQKQFKATEQQARDEIREIEREAISRANKNREVSDSEVDDHLRRYTHFWWAKVGRYYYLLVNQFREFEKGGGVGMNDFGIGDKVMYDTFRDGTKEGEILREIDDNHWEIGSGFGVSMVNKDKVVGFAPKRRFGLFEEGGNIDDIVTG